MLEIRYRAPPGHSADDCLQLVHVDLPSQPYKRLRARLGAFWQIGGKATGGIRVSTRDWEPGAYRVMYSTDAPMYRKKDAPPGASMPGHFVTQRCWNSKYMCASNVLCLLEAVPAESVTDSSLAFRVDPATLHSAADPSTVQNFHKLHPRFRELSIEPLTFLLPVPYKFQAAFSPSSEFPIDAALACDPALRVLYAELVPASLDHRAFCCNYFYRMSLLPIAEVDPICDSKSLQAPKRAADDYWFFPPDSPTDPLADLSGSAHVATSDYELRPEGAHSDSDDEIICHKRNHGPEARRQDTSRSDAVANVNELPQASESRVADSEDRSDIAPRSSQDMYLL
jgi:hypothetical protein